MKKVLFKIFFHWILVITAITLISLFTENIYLKSGLIAGLVATLVFNKYSYIRMKEKEVELLEYNFLFIKKVKLKLEKSEIRNINSIMLNSIESGKNYVEFEGVFLLEILTGEAFYKPRFRNSIELNSGQKIRFDTNGINNKLSESFSL